MAQKRRMGRLSYAALADAAAGQQRSRGGSAKESGAGPPQDRPVDWSADGARGFREATAPSRQQLLRRALRSTTALQSGAPTVRVAIYARYSSDLQDHRSIDGQILFCREYAARFPNWVIVGIYKDEAISGASLVLRPDMQRLLRDAKRKQFDLVLSEDLDRLCRHPRDMADIWDRLTYAGVKIYTPVDGEVDELRAGFRGIMNAQFLRNLSAKIRRGLKLKVSGGKAAGPACYGYEVHKHVDAAGEPIRGDRTINPREAEIIRRALTEYADGIGPIKIVDRFNNCKPAIPGPNGGKWNVEAITGHRWRGTGLINNQLYIGILVWNRTHTVTNPDTGKRNLKIGSLPKFPNSASSATSYGTVSRLANCNIRSSTVSPLSSTQSVSQLRARPSMPLIGRLACFLDCCGATSVMGGTSSVGRAGMYARTISTLAPVRTNGRSRGTS